MKGIAKWARRAGRVDNKIYRIVPLPTSAWISHGMHRYAESRHLAPWRIKR